MKSRVLLPALLAIGIVSFNGTQADAFELLDGMLSLDSYGGGEEVSCDSKATCAPTCCARKCCVPRSVYCKTICIPRLCLLDKAYCHVRTVAADIHCKTKAVANAVKVRLFCPCCRSCCQSTCCAEQKGGISVQKDLEVQK